MLIPFFPQVSVEINGADAVQHSLLIFADPVEVNVPSRSDPSVLFFEAGSVDGWPRNGRWALRRSGVSI
jgi:hypothetical protein